MILDVLADDRDGQLVLWIEDTLQHRAPIANVERLGPQVQLLDDQLVELVLDQADRHFVNRLLLVALLDDGAAFDVAEHGDLLGHVAGHFALGAADQHVGLDTDAPQLLDAVLRRFRLRFAGRLQIRNQRQVDVQAVVLADVERELANRFEKWQTFNVADRAADFGDDHVHIIGGELADGRLDLVGDVWNHLDGATQIVAVAFLLNDGQVNLARGEIAVAGQRRVGEAFVVAEVEVGFGAVVEDVDFAVLIRTHRARIDVDVRIELLQAHAQTAMFEQHADRGAGETFAQRTNHAAGNENMLGH